MNVRTLRKKQLGQYFTPERISSLMVDALEVFGALKSDSTVMDPACGEGVFLLEMLDRGVMPENIFGIDNDRKLFSSWNQSQLKNTLNSNLKLGDSLKNNCKKYSVLIGNPPFGGDRIMNISGERKVRLEERFAEQFLDMTKEGGWVVVILPSGIFSNKASLPFRQSVLTTSTPRSIIELSGKTFVKEGANVSTCILFAQKNSKRKITNKDSLIFSSPNYGSGYENPEDFFRDVMIDIRNFNSGIDSYITSQLVNLSELWLNRWDPAYWDPSYFQITNKLKKSKYEVEHLGNLDGNLEESGYLSYITYGQPGKRHLTKKGVRYITTRNFDSLGLDIDRCVKYIKQDGPNDPERSRPEPGDVLICGNGVACVGRSAVYDHSDDCNIEQNVVLLRPRGLPAEYIDTFFKSQVGQMQIKRLTTGAGTAYLNFPNIRSLLIPIYEPSRIREIVKKWRMFHWAYQDKSPQASEIMRNLLDYFDSSL